MPDLSDKRKRLRKISQKAAKLKRLKTNDGKFVQPSPPPQISIPIQPYALTPSISLQSNIQMPADEYVFFVYKNLSPQLKANVMKLLVKDSSQII